MGEDKETLEKAPDSAAAFTGIPAVQDAEPRGVAVPDRLLQALVSQDPMEVYSWICAGDPLALYALGSSRVRQRYLLLEPDRIYERAVATFAHLLLRLMGIPNDEQAAGTMDRVITYLLDDDREAERRGDAPPDEGDPRYSLLVTAMAVDPVKARTASVEFNNLPERARRAFFQLLMDNQPVPDALAEGPWTRESLRDDLRDTLATLGHWEHDPPEKKKRGKR